MKLEIDVSRMVVNYKLDGNSILEEDMNFIDNDKALFISHNNFPIIDVYILESGKQDCIMSVDLTKIDEKLVVEF